MNHISLYIKYLLLFWCVSGAITGESRAEGTPVVDTEVKIRQAYQRFIGLPQLENALVSLTVLDGQTGQPIFMANEKIGMTPASTLKNITAATALDLLGENFRFRTELAYLGSVDVNGVLHGDLVVVGSGDPSLGSDRFEDTGVVHLLQKWSEALAVAGIRRIEGRILANDLLYGGYRSPGGWPWYDLGNYYGAGVSGLNWRENVFGVTLQPGLRVGEPTQIATLSTEVPHVKLINEVTTGARGTGDQVYGYAAPYSELIFLRGLYGADLRKTISLSLPDPAYQLVHELKNRLEEAGIQHNGTVGTLYRMKSRGEDVDIFREGLTTVMVHESPPLRDLVYWFNQKSINLYGEALLMTVARKVDPDHGWDVSGNSREAAQLMRDLWVGKSGLPASSLQITDGSGLSPDNRTTTFAQASILAICRDKDWFEAFYNSLPTNNGMK